MSVPDGAIEYLRSLLPDDSVMDPDKLVDALGLVLLAYPTPHSKEFIAEMLGALRADLKNPDLRNELDEESPR